MREEFIFSEENEDQGLFAQVTKAGLVISFFAEGGYAHGKATIPWNIILHNMPPE